LPCEGSFAAHRSIKADSIRFHKPLKRVKIPEVKILGFISQLFNMIINVPWAYLRDHFKVFGSYGLAIILFSVVMKVILLPLSIKQQHSRWASRKSCPSSGSWRESIKPPTPRNIRKSF
jgi:membrane protein insertase Oxa1/YidC/SpoIIIJ